MVLCKALVLQISSTIITTKKTYSFDKQDLESLFMLASLIGGIFGTKNERELKRMRKIVDKINALEPTISALGDADLSAKTEEFKQRGVKAIALSVDDIESHLGWIKDINATQNTTVNFPIIADQDRKVSELYGFIHPNASETLTVRSLVIIDPNKKVRLIITYPASTGRNFHEILRVIDSLQLTDHHKVATPANWQQGEDVVIVPSLKDEAEIAQRFPKGYKAVTPYLRLTPQPEQG
jgi:thioredoxin-dependent peroxiredoxin